MNLSDILNQNAGNLGTLVGVSCPDCHSHHEAINNMFQDIGIVSGCYSCVDRRNVQCIVIRFESEDAVAISVDEFNGRNIGGDNTLTVWGITNAELDFVGGVDSGEVAAVVEEPVDPKLLRTAVLRMCPLTWKEPEIRGEFEPFGSIEEFIYTKGIKTIVYTTEESATKAVEALNGKRIKNDGIEVGLEVLLGSIASKNEEKIPSIMKATQPGSRVLIISLNDANVPDHELQKFIRANAQLSRTVAMNRKQTTVEAVLETPTGARVVMEKLMKEERFKGITVAYGDESTIEASGSAGTKNVFASSIPYERSSPSTDRNADAGEQSGGGDRYGRDRGDRGDRGERSGGDRYGGDRGDRSGGDRGERSGGDRYGGGDRGERSDRYGGGDRGDRGGRYGGGDRGDRGDRYGGRNRDGRYGDAQEQSETTETTETPAETTTTDNAQPTENEAGATTTEEAPSRYGGGDRGDRYGGGDRGSRYGGGDRGGRYGGGDRGGDREGRYGGGDRGERSGGDREGRYGGGDRGGDRGGRYGGGDRGGDREGRYGGGDRGGDREGRYGGGDRGDRGDRYGGGDRGDRGGRYGGDRGDRGDRGGRYGGDRGDRGSRYQDDNTASESVITDDAIMNAESTTVDTVAPVVEEVTQPIVAAQPEPVPEPAPEPAPADAPNSNPFYERSVIAIQQNPIDMASLNKQTPDNRTAIIAGVLHKVLLYFTNDDSTVARLYQMFGDLGMEVVLRIVTEPEVLYYYISQAL